MASLWDDFAGVMGDVGSLYGVPSTPMGLRTADTGLNLLANYGAAATAAYGQGEAARAARQGQAIQQENLTNINNEMAQGRAATAPGTSYLRGVVATPAGQLTPAEQQGLGIAQKQEQTQLATSGLRGAGQAQLDAMRQLQNNYVGNAVQSNIQRQDQAGSTLAGANASMYGRTAFPTTLGAGSAGGLAAGAGEDLAKGATMQGGALTASADDIASGLVGPAIASMSPSGTPASSFDALSSYIGASNKGQSRYQGGPQTPLANAGTGGGNGASDNNSF